MRATPILVLGGACLVALTAAHLMSESAAPAPTGASAGAHPALEAAPRKEPTPRPAARPLPSVAAGEAAPAPAPAVPPDPADQAKRDQAQVARIEQDLGARLRAERVDPAWAPGAQQAIASTLSGPAFAGLRLEHVTCGATLCRVGLAAGEQVADVEGLVEELTSTPAFRHGGFMRYTGRRAVTMFVARQGHPLPPPPRA